MNWVCPVIVTEPEIEKIILTRFYIIIEGKGKKQVKLLIYFFETEQKNDIYRFYIELAQQKKIQLNRTGI
jgi:hypothetical protein